MLFPTPVAKTPEQYTVADIDRNLRSAANNMLVAYNEIRRLVYANPYKLTPEQVYAAFQTVTGTGLSAAKLGEAAKLIKASVNHFNPGKIVDSVPEATITF